MPRYTPNQTNNTATFEVFPLGEYELIIGEPKPFTSEDKPQQDGTTKTGNYGIRYALTIAEGPFAGKKYIKTCYMHTQGSEDMTKQFMLAAHGFESNFDSEKLFNDKIATMDQTFNSDDGSCGDYWTSIKGGRVKVTLATTMYQGKEQNQEKGWSKL